MNPGQLRGLSRGRNYSAGFHTGVGGPSFSKGKKGSPVWAGIGGFGKVPIGWGTLCFSPPPETRGKKGLRHKGFGVDTFSGISPPRGEYPARGWGEFFKDKGPREGNFFPGKGQISRGISRKGPFPTFKTRGVEKSLGVRVNPKGGLGPGPGVNGREDISQAAPQTKKSGGPKGGPGCQTPKKPKPRWGDWPPGREGVPPGGEPPRGKRCLTARGGKTT